MRSLTTFQFFLYFYGGLILLYLGFNAIMWIMGG